MGSPKIECILRPEQSDTVGQDAGSRLWFTPELQTLILKEAWQGPTAEYRPFTPASNGVLACILRTCSYSFDIASALLYEREPTIWADLLDHEERIRESWNKSGLRGHQARTRMSDSRLHYYIGLVKKFSVARYRYPDLATLKGPLLKRFTLYHNAEQADFNVSPDCAVTVTRDIQNGRLSVVHLRKWLDSPTLKAQSELLCTIPGLDSCRPKWLELYREESNLLAIPPQLEFDTAADLYSRIECLIMDGMRLPYSDLLTLRKITPFLTKLDVWCSPPDEGTKITLDHIDWPLLRTLSFKANLNQWNFDLEKTIDGLVHRNPNLRYLSFPMALPQTITSKCLIPSPPSLNVPARWQELLELNLSIKAETDADRPLIATTYLLCKLISRQCLLTFTPNTLAFPPPGSFDTWNRAGIERAVYWGHTIVRLRKEYMEYLWQEKMDELTKIPGWKRWGPVETGGKEKDVSTEDEVEDEVVEA